MRIIFSRDRPAQLDLLLRSLQAHAPAEKTYVLWRGTNIAFMSAYHTLTNQAPTVPPLFDRNLRAILANDGAEYVTFFCDDDVLFRDLEVDPAGWLRDDDQALTFSWRLSAAAISGDDALGMRQAAYWRWPNLVRTDHGYPGSIDGHTFRVADVLEMLGDERVPDPTMLETRLAARCEDFVERRPLMAAPEQQVLVGIPVNRVSEPSGCPFGEWFPQPTAELNERFLAGERISLAHIEMHLAALSGIESLGCHREIEFVWEPT